LLPSEILEKLNILSDHRLLPSRGLTSDELAMVLTRDGHNCLIYTKSTHSDFFSIFRIYIESGIPLIVILQNSKIGHAVVAIGHEDIIPEYSATTGWQDVADFSRKIVLMDDNMIPYQMVDTDAPTKQYKDPNLSNMQIVSFIAPLQKHMFLDAGQAFDLVKMIFNDKYVGLKKNSEQWQTRLLLTSGRAFKHAVLHDKIIDSKIKSILIRIALPKFIWMCEIYRKGSLQKGVCEGLLLFDSTGSNSLSSVILYFLDDKNIITDGSSWTGIKTMIPFSMETYRHNLKGDWNSWKI